MKADTKTVQEILHGDRRFVVPVYQRPYVWDQERQWEPLWADVEATAIRLVEVRRASNAQGQVASVADQGASPHFLGAVVIEDRHVMTGAVDTRLVVDGQQRLTTLQLLLRGILDALGTTDTDTRLRARLRKAINNDEEVVGPSELLKVVPRRAEQPAFEMAMGDPPPQPDASKFAAARDFFRQQASAFLGDLDIPNDPYATGSGHAARASLLVATVLGLVKLVVIDLEDVDDAQVIFEALNARNTPLSATDLVKNLLFLRAQAQHHDADELYQRLWARFDDDSAWWMHPIGVGHAQRARQDWLLGDWLIAQLGRAINVGRLYGEFRGWLDESGEKPFRALETLNQYADAYEVLYGRRAGASELERAAFRRIEGLGITVAMPVMLWLFVQSTEHLPPLERQLALRAIESFVVRRMAAKYQTRAYGQVFVEALKAAQAAHSHPGVAIVTSLRAGPHGYAWPTDSELVAAFATGRYYGPGGISQHRLRLLFGAVDSMLQLDARKSEAMTIRYEDLQVEHIIPQGWHSQWPITVADAAAQAQAEQRREESVNHIGNLTLANGVLNPAMSNNPWEAKRAELRKHSKLQLNALLVDEQEWNEERIWARDRWLAEQVGRVWPGPSSDVWDKSDS